MHITSFGFTSQASNGKRRGRERYTAEPKGIVWPGNHSQLAFVKRHEGIYAEWEGEDGGGKSPRPGNSFCRYAEGRKDGYLLRVDLEYIKKGDCCYPEYM